MGPEMRTLISLEGAEWKAGVVVDKDNSDSKEYHLRKLELHRQTSSLYDGHLTFHTYKIRKKEYLTCQDAARITRNICEKNWHKFWHLRGAC